MLCVPSVARVTSAVFVPSVKCQTAVAVTVIAAALLFLKVNVHEAVFAPVVGALQVFTENESGAAGEKCGVIDVNVAVVPAGSAFVVTVTVCEEPTSLTPFEATVVFASMMFQV